MRLSTATEAREEYRQTHSTSNGDVPGFVVVTDRDMIFELQ
jgi:hypothetical protein